MEEAILLHQALNGGPSGPGTGLTRAQPVTGEIVPQMNMLGISRVPSQRDGVGFQQRFEQGINGLPATMFNPNEQMLGQGIPGQGGMFDPMMQGRPPLVGQPNSPFIDPTQGMRPGMGQGMGQGMGPGIGQGMGPGMGQGMGQGMRPGMGQGMMPGMRPGMMPPASGTDMHFHETPTNSHSHAMPAGRGGGRGVGVGFPGEAPVRPPVTTGRVRAGGSGQEVANFNARNAALRTRFNITQPDVLNGRAERQGEVSPLQEDEYGIFFLFYPRTGSTGIRVNFTKDGFCRRVAVTRERNVCTNMCYSDNQCPRDLKCCPSGCSLSCLQVNVPPPDTAVGPPRDVPAGRGGGIGRGGSFPGRWR